MNIFSFVGKQQKSEIDSAKTIAKMQAQKLKNQATVIRNIVPGKIGRLKFGTTYWFGLAIDPDQVFAAGASVQVCYRDGNTLYVRAFSDALQKL